MARIGREQLADEGARRSGDPLRDDVHVVRDARVRLRQRRRLERRLADQHGVPARRQSVRIGVPFTRLTKWNLT